MYGLTMTNSFYHDDEAALNEAFVGRKVVEVTDDTFILDDGSKLTVVPNEGCGGCGEGWYEIASIASFDHIITGVKVAVEGYDRSFSLIFYSVGIEGKGVEVVGGDNGYYGTGFSVRVSLETA